jgi:hypothetical protein
VSVRVDVVCEWTLAGKTVQHCTCRCSVKQWSTAHPHSTRPTCPGGPQEVKAEHDDDGCVAKLPVGAAAEQVADCVLPCSQPV